MARKRKTDKEFKPVANPALAEGLRALAFGNAAGTHLDRRTRRQRTWQAAKDKSIKDNNE